jgi:hypothetical protein
MITIRESLILLYPDLRLTLLSPLFLLLTITEVNHILLKRNDYALDCTAKGTDLQTYCSVYPYKYFCNDQGKVKCAMKSENVRVTVQGHARNQWRKSRCN